MCPFTSVARIGPRPRSSHSLLTPNATQNSARNSALGACPDMYRRTVSGFVVVNSPMWRNERSPAAAKRRS